MRLQQGAVSPKQARSQFLSYTPDCHVRPVFCLRLTKSSGQARLDYRNDMRSGGATQDVTLFPPLFISLSPLDIEATVVSPCGTGTFAYRLDIEDRPSPLNASLIPRFSIRQFCDTMDSDSPPQDWKV